jgi:hypothetical protein
LVFTVTVSVLASKPEKLTVVPLVCAGGLAAVPPGANGEPAAEGLAELLVELQADASASAQAKPASRVTVRVFDTCVIGLSKLSVNKVE